MKENTITVRRCPRCKRALVFSEELQKCADNNLKDAGNCFILDGWHCPVCDY